MRIGVIGVGTMGSRMVGALVGAGHEVLARDIAAAAEARARELGARALPSPSALAREAPDAVLLSLPLPSDVAEVVAGTDGILATARPGGIIVDLSTVDPSSTRRMAELARSRGLGYIDAPVLGRPQNCGKWTLPVGGDEASLAKVSPALSVLAQRLVPVGPSGAGNVVKLLNNLMFGAINAVTAEVMAVCDRTGVEPRVFFEAVSSSGAATVSNLFLELGAKMLQRDYSPLFTIDLLRKDNRLGLEMAAAVGTPLVLSRTTQMLNELAAASGLGTEDTSALVKVYEHLYETKAGDADRVATATG